MQNSPLSQRLRCDIVDISGLAKHEMMRRGDSFWDRAKESRKANCVVAVNKYLKRYKQSQKTFQSSSVWRVFFRVFPSPM